MAMRSSGFTRDLSAVLGRKGGREGGREGGWMRERKEAKEEERREMQEGGKRKGRVGEKERRKGEINKP